MTGQKNGSDAAVVNIMQVARRQARRGFGAPIVCSQEHAERLTGYVVAWTDDKSQAWVVHMSTDANFGSFGRAQRGLPARDRIICRSCDHRLDLGYNALRDHLAATVAASGLAKVELVILVRLAASKT